MEERANILDEGIDRVQSVWNSAEDEFDRLQKNLQKRRRQWEKETEKQVKKLRKTPLMKRAASIFEDAQRQVDRNVETFVGYFPVASSSEIKRLERRISQLTKKVNALEKANGATERRAKPSGQDGARAATA